MTFVIGQSKSQSVSGQPEHVVRSNAGQNIFVESGHFWAEAYDSVGIDLMVWMSQTQFRVSNSPEDTITDPPRTNGDGPPLPQLFTVLPFTIWLDDFR